VDAGFSQSARVFSKSGDRRRDFVTPNGELPPAQLEKTKP
jgi:hypothetical protein